ncbi:MAG: hypothetical protein ACHBN1_24355 [Heteroscytonema crispum UTEX LB 1556]
MKNLPTDNNVLLIYAAKTLKYFLLAVFCFAIVCIMSQVFGAAFIGKLLLSASVWKWFLRMAVFIFCLFAIAMIWESWE